MHLHQPRLNLGIVAHVDAGKTTLTERLLYETGVSSHLGRVDHGDTVTDADAIERRRGITIRSAVVAFTIDDLKVNLIDTPGHADFVAEVERALAVLDGAVLVVSAVEGIQAQTRALIRIMERLGIPFLVFANKIDRIGASVDGTLAALREALAGDAIALNDPAAIGSRSASVTARRGPDFATSWPTGCRSSTTTSSAAYVEGSPPPECDLLASLTRATAAGRMHPVVFGAALTGVGVRDVLAAVAAYLPPAGGSPDDPLHASVFKIEQDAGGHPLAYLRMRGGTLTSRDDVVRHHRGPRRRSDAGRGTCATGGDVRRRCRHHRHDRRRRRHRHRRRAARRRDRGPARALGPGVRAPRLPATRARVRRRRTRPGRPRAAVRGRPAAQRPGPAHRRPARRRGPGADRQPLRRGAARGAHRAAGRGVRDRGRRPRVADRATSSGSPGSASGRSRSGPATPAWPTGSSPGRRDPGGGT